MNQQHNSNKDFFEGQMNSQSFPLYFPPVCTFLEWLENLIKMISKRLKKHTHKKTNKQTNKQAKTR